MNITINTEATRALGELTTELARLEAQRPHIEDRALAGELDASRLGDYNARVDLLQTRRAAAERRVAAERGSMGSERDIATAIASWKADPALAVDELAKQLENIAAAVASFHSAVAERNAAISTWAGKLDALGVPSHGFEVDGEPVSIRHIGAEARISIGGASVQTNSAAASYVVGVLDNRTREARPLSPESLAADDRRTEKTEHLEVRLLKDLGGLPTGSTLSTRAGRHRSALARMVHTGHAEVVSGNLPEPSLTEQILHASAEAEEARVIEAASVRL